MTKMRTRWLCVLCTLVMVGGVCFAQDKKDDAAATSAPSDGRHYQVVFVAQELESGKVVSSRRYVTDMALTGPGSASGSIRTGAKVAVGTGLLSMGGKEQTQFTYIDMGFSVDFNRARLEGDKVFLWVAADLSSAGPASTDSTQMHEPTILQNKWDAGVTVPLGKPSVIFSSDDVSSKRTVQIELTVTPAR